MDLSNLTPAKGSIKNRKRIGRGQGSTRGGTSTRGHKGQQSRSGYSRKVGFEGGQQPIQRRVPKFGFKNINRKEYRGINLDTLQWLVDNKKVKEVNVETLITNGLVSKNDLIKILGRGELKTKLEVRAHAFSKSARTAVEEKGGKAVLLTKTKTEARPAVTTSRPVGEEVKGLDKKKNKDTEQPPSGSPQKGESASAQDKPAPAEKEEAKKKSQLSGNGTKAEKIKRTESEAEAKKDSNKASKNKKITGGEEKTLSKEKPRLSGDGAKVNKPKTNGNSKTFTKTPDPVASAETKTGKPAKDN